MALQTAPPFLSIATTDYPTISANMSSILHAGETISSVKVTMNAVGAAQIIRLPDNPSISGGNTILQKIKGSLLTVGQQYRVVWILTLSSGDVISQTTTVTAPY